MSTFGNEHTTTMKAFDAGLWSIWLSGLVLIALSLYASQSLPSLNDHVIKSNIRIILNPTVSIFSSPNPFIANIGIRQNLAIHSWLALSQQINVILFSQDPSVVSFARSFSSRVYIESDIDFTFLGTPYFHSMMAKSQSFTSDIFVFVDPETFLLPDFISTLNYAYKLDHDWLLVATSQNVSYSQFDFDGKLTRIQEELFNERSQNSRGRELLAWNNWETPLHNGVLPPFLYGRGVHNNWVINEAIASEFRFVFDASWTISSFLIQDSKHSSDERDGNSNSSDMGTRNWEYFGNSLLGTLYGTSFNHGKYSSPVKLLKCNGQYIFINKTEDILNQLRNQRMLSLWNAEWLHIGKKKKPTVCDHVFRSVERLHDSSMEDGISISSSATLELPFSLEFLLPLIADKNKTIVLAIAGYSYKEMLMSWACRLRRLRIRNFLVCALDRETYQFSILQGLPVYQDPFAPTNISFNDCHFGTDCFQKVTKVKSRMVLRILKLGYNVLLSDVDVYWFKNPLHFLYSFGSGVLAAQSDEYKKTGPVNLPRRLNSGFYFARSDDSTIAAMEKVVKHAATSGLSEQPSFYDTLCGEGGINRIGSNKCLEPETNLTVHFLDRNLFPNGAYLGLWKKKNIKAACKKKGCLVLHNNWINGRIKKLERQLFSGLWEYDMSTRMCKQN